MEPCRDRAALNAVAAQLRCPYLLLEAGSNGTEIVALIRRMSLVIAMRLHTLIFAAGQGVPIVGVVYDPKVSGFLDYLGQDLYLPLEEASAASLCDLIDTGHGRADVRGRKYPQPAGAGRRERRAGPVTC